MRLAIADPPYFGRADRWYGEGRGHGYGIGRADSHPDAKLWDTEAAHVELVARLTAEYDGWVIAAHASSLALYAPILPARARTLIWYKRNGVTSGSRVTNRWEPVFSLIPESRMGRNGFDVSDVLDAPAQANGFVGSKPEAWTRWVLSVMGYNPDTDTVDDIFAGSGRVAAAADGMLI